MGSFILVARMIEFIFSNKNGLAFVDHKLKIAGNIIWFNKKPNTLLEKWFSKEYWYDTSIDTHHITDYTSLFIWKK